MLPFLRRQTRQADRIIISAVSERDVPPPPADLPVECIFGPKGLPAQRNTGLRALREAGEAGDVVIFFDDDFAPAPNYLAGVEALFSAQPGVAGANGQVIADGISGPGYTFADASRFISTYRQDAVGVPVLRPLTGLYGCNMAIRLASAEGLVFDEALPLYAWQEDIDFTVQLSARGRLVHSNGFAGVHLGVKSARTPGLPMGYSQIANPIFLRRKRTMEAAHAYKLMARNVAANLVYSFKPEPWCDRRGRLAGNVRALVDLALGRLHPGNILKLK
jgi:glycosyltransferase involved in cell wall biosynthesis